MLSMVKFLPYGLVMGAVISVTLLWAAWRIRKLGGRTVEQLWPKSAFWTYLSVMLMITFLSRESGSGQGMDLQLFSTWGINDRNNAYVVENVLLFIPYGFLGAWVRGPMRRFFGCAFLGAATSLGIEFLQLVTKRGFFQVDDILTNTLGTVIGYLLFRLLAWLGK